MHIILGDQNVQEVADKYVVLELDAFRMSDQAELVSAFCVIENVPIHELPQVHHFRDLHQQLIKNYRCANWKFCTDALEHLCGRWNGEVDTFYNNLRDRIQDLCDRSSPAPDWDYAISI